MTCIVLMDPMNAVRTFAVALANLWGALLITDMGLMDMPDLCVSGKPYIVGVVLSSFKVFLSVFLSLFLCLQFPHCFFLFVGAVFN